VGVKKQDQARNRRAGVGNPTTREELLHKVSLCFPNEALTIVNNLTLEYPMLVALEDDNVNEYKSFFSIVLDYPLILGQGETKKYLLQQAT
jgi:hypothetical protein